MTELNKRLHTHITHYGFSLDPIFQQMVDKGVEAIAESGQTALGQMTTKIYDSTILALNYLSKLMPINVPISGINGGGKKLSSDFASKSKHTLDPGGRLCRC
jgi:hypothetical protein